MSAGYAWRAARRRRVSSCGATISMQSIALGLLPAAGREDGVPRAEAHDRDPSRIGVKQHREHSQARVTAAVGDLALAEAVDEDAGPSLVAAEDREAGPVLGLDHVAGRRAVETRPERGSVGDAPAPRPPRPTRAAIGERSTPRPDTREEKRKGSPQEDQDLEAPGGAERVEKPRPVRIAPSVDPTMFAVCNPPTRRPTRPGIRLRGALEEGEARRP